jgi:SPP1 family predicted phage head-tail adaptor
MSVVAFPAGELDRRIELQAATVTNDPDYNEEVLVWATYATVWARMEFHRSFEAEAQGREYAQMALFFTVRWRDDIEAEHRIVYDGDTYEIIGRPRELGRRQGLMVEARMVE